MRAIEAATARIGAVSLAHDTLWNPDTIPCAFLPWLAWSLSVDTWDAEWSEPQKRAVIKASIPVHMRKGTAGAMMDALKALSHSAEMVEWFSQAPAGDPGTFRIDVAIDSRGIVDGIWGEVERTALAAKNARSHLTAVRLLHTSPSPGVVAAAITAAEIVSIQPWHLADIASIGQQLIGVAISARETVTLSPPAN